MINSIVIKGLILLLILQVTRVKAQDYDYDENSGRGPSQWGNLNSEWAACGDGQRQSPIDLSQYLAVTVPRTEEIITNYRPSNTTLQNRGHDIALQWSDGGSIQINGIDYTLMQVHWHSPSEHTINGTRYDLERHAVHSNEATGEVAVIGVLYQIGQPDPFLSQLMTNLTYMVNASVNETSPGIIDLNSDSLSNDDYFYRYEGSLTTPPCREGIIWSVQQKIRTVAREQVGLLEEAVHNQQNARPLQPLNGREINLFGPRKASEWSIISSPLEYTEKSSFIGAESM